MEDLYYFIVHNISAVAGIFLKHSLERKIHNQNYWEARREYRDKMKLYKKGEIDYRPTFKEIYEKYSH